MKTVNLNSKSNRRNISHLTSLALACRGTSINVTWASTLHITTRQQRYTCKSRPTSKCDVLCW